MARATENRSESLPSEESRSWLSDLRGEGRTRDDAIGRLHALLLRAANFEVARRRPALTHLRGGDFGDVALQSANDALVAVLAKLDDYQGASRFTTWAYKFGLLEAAVKLRRLAWQGRELPLAPEGWSALPDQRPSVQQDLEGRELLRALQQAVESELTPHQREVFTALAVSEVPIDVLAERLGTTRGALYKTLHDARGKLRAHLSQAGLAFEAQDERP
jgi:RNA polymerase sigma-70 factor, ECF subfamily